jgi:hypothetical protein
MAIAKTARPKTPAPAAVTFREVIMTPTLAREILGKNTRNRTIRQNRIERYAAEMAAGRWKQNGETISISDKNNLMNGQHRLLAVIKADTSVKMTIAEGIDETAFSTIDSGLSRTGGDVLAMRGVSNFNQVSAMVRMILNYKDGSSINTPRSPFQIEEAIIKHPEIAQYATSFGPLFNIGRSVAVSVCTIADLFSDEDSSEDIEEFVRGVSTGVNLSQFDPRLTFRNKLLIMNKDRQRRPEQSVVWYYAQRALSHHLSGAKVAKLSSQRGVAPYFSEIPSATREMVRAKW